MPGPVTFETRDTLLERLLAARREIVFLVGAPLTAPERSSTLGVPDVTAMVARIRAHIAVHAPRTLGSFDDAVKTANAYQAAFGFRVAVPLFAAWIRERA